MNSTLNKAVLLAAGKGTRMKGLTADLPKPMIPVAGVPILERILMGLRDAAIRQFLVITGYQADAVHAHFGDGSAWDVSICYSHQTVQDGTGRVIELAKDFVKGEAFLLSYGDILVPKTVYQGIQDQWAKNIADGLLTVQLGEDIRKGAVAIFDGSFYLRELIEKPTAAEIQKLRAQFGDFKPWYNAGIYVFTPRIFDYAAGLQKSARGEYELTDAIRQMISDGIKFCGLKITGDWMDVRDPEALAKAHRQFGKAS